VTVTVLTGPSGVGKGTVVTRLIQQHPEIWLSVSVTTRPPRPAEKHGVNYWFISDDEFDALALAVNQLLSLLGAQPAETARLRKACAEAEKRYRRLEAAIPGLVFVYQFRPDGIPCFPYVSEATRNLFHVEPEEAMRDGSLIANRIHPDDRERRDRAIQRSFETLQPFREELRHIVDGEVRWHDCLSSLERQPDGIVLGYGIILDITARKRAEEALRESEAKYRRLHDSMTDAFAAADMEGRLTEFNRAYEEMLGYSGEELRRMTYQDLTPEKWHSLQAKMLREQVLTRGFSDVFEKEYRRKDGTIFPVELMVQHLVEIIWPVLQHWLCWK